MTTLHDLNQGESGIILKVRGRGSFRKRITEMGFVKGKRVTVVKAAPLQDPIEYRIMGYYLSLRQRESKLIEIVPEHEFDGILRETDLQGTYAGTIETSEVRIFENDERGRTIDIALVGNPNCGKTTLFNYASGSHERVGNFSGVTVDSKEARFHQKGYTFNITDLPGTYSLTAYSPEELFVRNHLINNNPDIIVNVVDASNLERNLFLTTQLIDMDLRVVIALNMFDEFEQKGHRIDYRELSKLLGIPVVPTVSSKGTGIEALFDRLIEVFEDRDPVVRHVHINYGADLERSIQKIQSVIRQNEDLAGQTSTRYLSIKLLEKDKGIIPGLESPDAAPLLKQTVEREIHRLEASYQEDSATLIAAAKYGFIAGAIRETVRFRTSKA
ncbi:MAG TPA: FeoB small GTPase domain-containing protein, partial [Bacteroidales bacterium]|nr:FeoB small GTPase domain-containing protein [Bacteroidales bacterium]